MCGADAENVRFACCCGIDLLGAVIYGYCNDAPVMDGLVSKFSALWDKPMSEVALKGFFQPVRSGLYGFFQVLPNVPPSISHGFASVKSSDS